MLLQEQELVRQSSLEEESLHLLVTEEAVVLELAVLLHGEELFVGGTTLQTLVTLLLERVKVGQVIGLGCALSGSCAVGHSEGPNLVNVVLAEVLRARVKELD